MPEPGTPHGIRDDAHLIACPHCDTLYHYIALHAKQRHAVCRQCQTTLYRTALPAQSSFIWALTTCLLFIGTHLFPFITLELPDSVTTIHILSSIRILNEHQLHLLAVFVLFTIFISPLAYLMLMMWFIVSLHLRLHIRTSKKILFFINQLPPWNMLEIYMLGVLVSIIKLRSLGDVRFDAGFWLMCALIFFTVFTSSKLSLQRLISDELHHDPSSHEPNHEVKQS